MNPNNIGSTANYDGYGTGENGVDNTKNDLDSSYYEEKEEKQVIDEENRPGANAQAIAEDLAREKQATMGATAVTASEAREASLDTSYQEQAALHEALEKDPTNEKVKAYLIQVNDYISKLINELDHPNTITDQNFDSMTAGQSITTETKDAKNPNEGFDNPSSSESDVVYQGKDGFISSNQQDALDSFAS